MRYHIAAEREIELKSERMRETLIVRMRLQSGGRNKDELEDRKRDLNTKDKATYPNPSE